MLPAGLRLWDPTTGNPLGLAGPADPPVSFAFVAGTKLLAYPRKAIHVWDTEANKEVRTIGPEEGISTLAVSADGKTIAGYRETGEVIVYDLGTARERRRVKTGGKAVGPVAVALSPDGGLIACGRLYGDSSVRVWDVATGKERPADAGHRGPATLSLSADGKTLVSRGGGQVFHWDLATGEGKAVPDDREGPGRVRLRLERRSAQVPHPAVPVHHRPRRIATGGPLAGWVEVDRPGGHPEGVPPGDGILGRRPAPGRVVPGSRRHGPPVDPRGTAGAVPPHRPPGRLPADALHPRRQVPDRRGRHAQQLQDRDAVRLRDGDRQAGPQAGDEQRAGQDAADGRRPDARHRRAVERRDRPGLGPADRAGTGDPGRPGGEGPERGRPKGGEVSAIGGLALSADERFLAVVTGHGARRRSACGTPDRGNWSRRSRRRSRGRSRRPLAVARDGRSVFVAYYDSTILEWDVSGRFGKPLAAAPTAGASTSCGATSRT